VVAQKANGTRLYDVKDSGRPWATGAPLRDKPRPALPHRRRLALEGARVRGPLLPRVRDAGGLSRFASLVTAHHELRRRRPDLLARLYQPFHWDRQGEHAPDAPRVSRQPVFEFEGGTLASRYYEDYVRNGSKMAGEELDDEAPRRSWPCGRSWTIPPTGRVPDREGPAPVPEQSPVRAQPDRFTDLGPGQGRHMLRLWNRDEGTWHLEGSPAA